MKYSGNVLKNFPLTRLIGWLLVLVLLTGCTAAAGTTSQAGTEEAASRLPRAPADERAKGDPNAPVTLIEYGDYQ